MKKILLRMAFLTLAMGVPVPAMADVDIHIGFPLPPPIVFPAPPDVIVLPDTPEVYVVPDIDVDLFFWGGWWWRPWEGRWYRSHYYDRDWVYYGGAPDFYFDVDPGWRGYYKQRKWYGHRWKYERIRHKRLHKYWKRWDRDRYWERQRRWGVHDYRPHPERHRKDLRRQRQDEYRHRPEVERHERERREYQDRGRPRGRDR